MKVDWKAKLTSRKFWVAIMGFVSSILVLFGVSESLAGQIASAILAGITVASYIIGEGLVDAAKIKNESGGVNE